MPRPAPMLPSDLPSPAESPSRREREQALLVRIGQGDAAAFEALYRAYYRPLLAFILPLVTSPAIAEEVIEDVFVEIWERRSTLVIRHGVNTYLFTAARNRALNTRRRERTERRFQEQVAGDLAAEVLRSAEVAAPHLAIHAIDRERISNAVRAAIDALPPQRRAVLLLRWDQQMSYAEIAAVVGSSVVAVERQLSRTLKALQLALPQWLRDDHG